jgi:membrane protease YdiL (CAAX protease family)
LTADESVRSSRSLATFFLISFGWSWSITSPLLLGGNGLGLLPFTVAPGPAFVLIVLQSYGPFAAALICSTSDQRRALLVRLRRWGGGWAIGILTLAGPPVSVLIGAMVVGGTPLLTTLQDGVALLPTFAMNLPVLLVLGGPLGEEPGWRGFALPRLQAWTTPLAASVMLGTIWALWHLPNFFIPQMGTWQGSKAAYLGLALILSLIHTGAFNVSAGSLLAVTLLHASIDASSRTLLPAMFGEDRARGTVALFVGFVALLVAIAWRGGLRSSAALRAVKSSPGDRSYAHRDL